MNRSVLIVTIVALCGSLAGASPALAQGDAGTQAGITTTGYGMATGPAETVRLEFLIADQDTLYSGLESLPEVEATPGAMARETVGPIEAAITAFDGVESVEVVVPLVGEPYGQALVARIDITVSAPDLDGLTGLVTEVVQVAAGERLLVGYVGARFETSDCATLERAAREAALADAQSRAGIQADLLGVSLGEVVASTDIDAASGLAILYGAQGVSGSNCDPAGLSFADGGFGSGASLPRFDPTSDSGEVEVYRQLQVTFAIDASEATPAS